MSSPILAVAVFSINSQNNTTSAGAYHIVYAGFGFLRWRSVEARLKPTLTESPLKLEIMRKKKGRLKRTNITYKMHKILN